MTNAYYIHNALIVNEGQRFSGGVLVIDGLISEVFHGKAPAGFPIPGDTIVIDAKEKCASFKKYYSYRV